MNRATTFVTLCGLAKTEHNAFVRLLKRSVVFKFFELVKRLPIWL